MSACFKDYYFGITEFVLSVYIVVSLFAPTLSLLLLMLLSLLLFLLVLLLFLLSLYSRHLLVLPFFTVIVVVRILPNFIIKGEPCTTCTLNDLVPASEGIEFHMTFKAKFEQRNTAN